MKYTKGDDFQESTCDLKTFGINENNSDETHANKIEIYGDEKLRNRILDLLNSAPESPNETIDESSELIRSDNLGPTDDQFSRFEKELENAINKTCMENGSNSPDFILAEYLVNCLKAFNKASRDREKWYGKSLKI